MRESELSQRYSYIYLGIGIQVAAHPGHHIDLHHVIPNNADGNCAFESTTDQINNSRNSESNNGFTDCGAGQFLVRIHTDL